MKRLLAPVRSHLRVGYVAGTALIVITFDCLALVDLIRARNQGVDPLLVLRVAPSLSLLLQAAGVSLVLAVLVPIVLAPPIALSRGRRLSTKLARARNRVWTGALVLGSIGAGLATLMSAALEKLAGPSARMLDGQVFVGSSFTSYFLDVTYYVATASVFLAAVVPGVVGVVHNLFGWPKPKRFKEYLAILTYQALPSDYAPIHGRRVSNFNVGGHAPMLEGVKKAMIGDMLSYQRKVPGTDNARKFLEAAWADCKRLLREYGVEGAAGRQVRLVPGGTSRALEIALTELPQGYHVVLSPFEHNSEWEVASQVRTAHRLRFSSALVSKPWPAQLESLAAEFTQLVESLENRPPGVILVTSGVCWATGLQIPVEEILAEVQERIHPTPVLLVVDGAHVVGNVALHNSWCSTEAYVFSGHKWLLAPEPCGLMVSKNPKTSYDAWIDSISTTTAGASAVLGLRAALNLSSEIPKETRQERTQALRERFLAGLDGKLRLVGGGTGLSQTNLMTVEPAEGYKWITREPAAFVRRFVDSHTNVLTVDEDVIGNPSETWVRIAMPFLSDWTEASRLAKLLTSMVG